MKTMPFQRKKLGSKNTGYETNALPKTTVMMFSSSMPMVMDETKYSITFALRRRRLRKATNSTIRARSPPQIAVSSSVTQKLVCSAFWMT